MHGNMNIKTFGYIENIYINNILWPTSQSRILEKLAVLQLVKKFPAFYGTRRFIRAFTRVRQLSPSWARPNQFLKIHFNIIQPSMPRPDKWSNSHGSFHQNTVCTSPLSHACQTPRPSHSSWFHPPNKMWWGGQIIKFLPVWRFPHGNE